MVLSRRIISIALCIAMLFSICIFSNNTVGIAAESDNDATSSASSAPDAATINPDSSGSDDASADSSSDAGSTSSSSASSSGSSAGSPIDSASLQKRLDEATAKSNRLRTLISNLELANAPYEDRLDAIQQQIEAIKAEIKLYDEEMEACKNEIAAMKEEIAAIKEKCEKITESFKKRLVAIYTSNNNPFETLSFLSSSDSFTDYLTKLELLDTISSNDNKAIKTLTEASDKIKKKKSAMASRQALLARLQDQDTAIRAELNADYEKLNEIVKANQNEIDNAEREAMDQDEIQRDIAAALGTVVVGNNGSGTGKFAWPVPGYKSISSKFGYRTNPVTGKHTLHAGVDIAGSGIDGRPIYAADTGTVILSKYYGGYGNCVMIDHGNGYITLYGHMKSLSPYKVGDTVYKGISVIGFVGSTGNSTGSHLHFEIKRNNTSVNPLVFFD